MVVSVKKLSICWWGVGDTVICIYKFYSVIIMIIQITKIDNECGKEWGERNGVIRGISEKGKWYNYFIKNYKNKKLNLNTN